MEERLYTLAEIVDDFAYNDKPIGRFFESLQEISGKCEILVCSPNGDSPVLVVAHWLTHSEYLHSILSGFRFFPKNVEAKNWKPSSNDVYILALFREDTLIGMSIVSSLETVRFCCSMNKASFIENGYPLS
jgi:hypothetical protein